MEVPSDTELEGVQAGPALYSGVDLSKVPDVLRGAARAMVTGTEKTRTFFDQSAFPGGKDWLMEHRQPFLGKLSNAELLAKNFADNFKDMPMNVREQVFNYLDGRTGIDTVDLSYRKSANTIKTIDSKLGDILENNGFITAEENAKGNHIRNLYNIYETTPNFFERKPSAGGFKIDKSLFEERHAWGTENAIKYLRETFPEIGQEGQTTLSNFLRGTVDFKNLDPALQDIAKQLSKKAEEFSAAERDSFGLIKDPVLSAAKSISDVLQNVATKKYFEGLSKDPNLTLIFDPKKINVTVGGVKEPWDIKKASDMFGKLQVIKKEKKLTPAQKVLYKDLRDGLSDVQMMAGKRLKDFTYLDGEVYGDLNGKFVRNEIANDITPFFEMFKSNAKGIETTLNIIHGVNAAWKLTKTSLNLPTAARNIGSNAIQMFMSGMAPQNIMVRAAQAANEFYKKGPMWKEANNQGLFRTNFTQAELKEIVDWAKQFEGDKTGRQFVKFVESGQKLSNYYGYIDDFWKMVKFLDVYKKGKPAKMAAYEANKWAMDYSLAHPAIKMLRNSVIGAPFLTYQTKILPLVLETAAKKPWVLFAMAAVPFAFEKLLYDKMTNEEAQNFRKNLPKYIRDGTGFLMPGYKGVDYLDMTNWLPWGNFMQIGEELYRKELGKAIQESGMMQGMFPSAIVAAMTNEDPRTKRPIISPLEQISPKDSVKAIMRYAGTQMLPPMLTEYGAAGKTYEYFKYGQNKKGLPLQSYHALPRWAGVNITPVDPKASALEMRHDQKELIQDYYKKLLNRNSTPEDRLKNMQLFRKGIEDIRARE
jgi:hypothetical protein